MTSKFARRARRRVRRPSSIAAVVAVIFLGLLFVWTRGLSGSSAVVVPAPTGALATPIAEGPQSDAAIVPPGGSGTAGAGTGAGTGLGTLPPDTVRHFTPGPHTVTVTATGDLGTVAYIFRGQSKEIALHNVRGPFRITRHVSGSSNLAAIGVQVYYAGTTATCSVIVDGQQVLTYTAHGPYRVVGCIV